MKHQVLMGLQARMPIDHIVFQPMYQTYRRPRDAPAIQWVRRDEETGHGYYSVQRFGKVETCMERRHGSLAEAGYHGICGVEPAQIPRGF